MNESGKANDEAMLRDLLARLLDDSITEPEHQALQERLRDDADAQQTYFDHLDLDTDLREMSHAMPIPNAKPRAAKRVRFRAAVAASVLAIASLTWWIRREGIERANPLPIPDVVLVQSAGGEFFRDVMPPVGQALRSNHPYALVAGVIELRFPSGAEVILDAPTVIEIAALDRLIVRQGSCSVYAPPGAEGFQVVTPKTEVTDLGTRFSVAVNEAGDTEVQVVEGAAEVQPRDRLPASKVLLRENQASLFEGGDSSSLEFQANKYRRQLPDRVMEFQMGSRNGKLNGELKRVSVQRGGTPRHYDVSELIGIEVTHFRGDANTQHMSVSSEDPAEVGESRRAVLESDTRLHTGFLNLGGSSQSLTRDPVLEESDGAETTHGMAIRFRKPIINAAGPDVVFFELQSALNPADGDGFHVSPLRFSPGLRSLTVMRYDITLNSAEALSIPDFDLLQFNSPVRSVDELLSGAFERLNPSIPFWAIVVGIDLSDLGYAQGDAVDGLFFQDARDDEQRVDPVFIAGLPAE
ncbi:FecR protein [Novipirellula galeiformis]|uniref:FecR protein n=1 Tax=Novipirellula galeiformis TaxID=2528004 RepID=A0A5C6CMH8_9BACT|nr:FecR family protein [Novipirellula galeiformis]TWU24356.1 FecR protein [Novipirellula galeiformis]